MAARRRRSTPANVTGIDAYAPAQIAELVERAGVAKAAMPLEKLLMLGLLAGAFVAFGAALYTLAIAGSSLGAGPTQLLGGAAFSLGLILVVIAGAELFTANNLIVMAWADGTVSGAALLRNWAATYIANGIGALAVVMLVFYAGVMKGDVGAAAIAVAESKLDLTFMEALSRGIGCNALVCLAVWLSYAASSVSGKILAILFPVTALAVLGFELSIANFFFLPLGIALGADGSLAGVVGNLVPVTVGNIIGGAGCVAFVYWVIYRRQD